MPSSTMVPSVHHHQAVSPGLPPPFGRHLPPLSPPLHLLLWEEEGEYSLHLNWACHKLIQFTSTFTSLETTAELSGSERELPIQIIDLLVKCTSMKLNTIGCTILSVI